jgi:hypothetical protein
MQQDSTVNPHKVIVKKSGLEPEVFNRTVKLSDQNRADSFTNQARNGVPDTGIPTV